MVIQYDATLANWQSGPPNTRTESTKPERYALSKKPDGSLCLLGEYQWTGYNEKGHMCGGSEWREIEMVEWPNAMRKRPAHTEDTE